MFRIKNFMFFIIKFCEKCTDEIIIKNLKLEELFTERTHWEDRSFHIIYCGTFYRKKKKKTLIFYFDLYISGRGTIEKCFINNTYYNFCFFLMLIIISNKKLWIDLSLLFQFLELSLLHITIYY